MSFELTGVLERIGETKAVSDKFSVREFALKYNKTWQSKDGDQGSKEVLVGMQCTGQNCEKLDKLKVGDTVLVKFDPEGREHSGRVYTNLTAWFFQKQEGATTQGVTANVEDDGFGLPF